MKPITLSQLIQMNNPTFTPTLPAFYEWVQTNYTLPHYTQISTRVIFAILGEFLFRCPLTLNLDEFIFRTSTIFMTYAPVLVSFEMDIQKQANFLQQLQNGYTERKTRENTVKTTTEQQNKTTSTATESFEPSDDPLTQTSTIAQNEGSTFGATITNTNVATSQNNNQIQNQDTTHASVFNETETYFSMETYKNLIPTTTRNLQPVLTAINSLFELFEYEEYHQWLFN